MDFLKKFKALWICNELNNTEMNQYVEFRREFSIEGFPAEDATLYISVDSDYAVWINGVFVNCGQYDDYPDSKVYDILPVSKMLKPGKNIICITVYYQGADSSQYIKGDSGLIYALKTGNTVIPSDSRTFCRKSAVYACGPAPKVSPQLSFTYEYNAALYDGWLSEAYFQDNSWISAIVKSLNNTISQNDDYTKRPVKKTEIKEKINTCILTQGVFIREADRKLTAAQMVQTDFLSPRLSSEIFIDCYSNRLSDASGIKLDASCIKPYTGFYIIVDLGREEAGFLELDIETGKGTVVDIAYGEHVNDMRVRAAVGGRNFTDRYICSEGRQNFIHYFRRIAGRYIELHVSNIEDGFKLYYCGLRPCEYPVQEKGAFRCTDNLYNKIYDIAVRTLHLCMHEHYEDTPWREQALYSMDSRNQALCGYYCFGEYDLPKGAIDLLGQGLNDDGYLELCAPAKINVTIPAFSFIWVREIADYLLYSGRKDAVEALLPKVEKILDKHSMNMSEGLLTTPAGKRYWNFYDWSEGLDGKISCNTEGNRFTRFDAPLNLFFCMALDAAAFLEESCGYKDHSLKYKELSGKIKKTFHIKFWDEGMNAYRTYCGIDNQAHFAELTQALAVCVKACEENIRSILRQKLADANNGMIKTTLSYSIYKYEALLEDPETYADIVFEELARIWGNMLFSGATSFWETEKGAEDFLGAGSLCHGWSAIPVYFYHAYILGIKPVEPGFKLFKANPVNSFLGKAEGKIPTPYGQIVIAYDKTSGKPKYKIKQPDKIMRS